MRHPRRPRRQWTGGGRSGCKDALPRQVRRYFATLMAAAAGGTNSGNGADAGRPEKDDAGQGGRGWPREEKACDDVVQGRTADPQAERRARPPGPVRSLGWGLSVHQGGRLRRHGALLRGPQGACELFDKARMIDDGAGYPESKRPKADASKKRRRPESDEDSPVHAQRQLCRAAGARHQVRALQRSARQCRSHTQ